VERALRGNAAMRRSLEELRRLQAELRGLPAHRLEPGFCHEVLHKAQRAMLVENDAWDRRPNSPAGAGQEPRINDGDGGGRAFHATRATVNRRSSGRTWQRLAAALAVLAPALALIVLATRDPLPTGVADRPADSRSSSHTADNPQGRQETALKLASPSRSAGDVPDDAPDEKRARFKEDGEGEEQRLGHSRERLVERDSTGRSRPHHEDAAAALGDPAPGSSAHGGAHSDRSRSFGQEIVDPKAKLARDKMDLAEESRGAERGDAKKAAPSTAAAGKSGVPSPRHLPADDALKLRHAEEGAAPEGVTRQDAEKARAKLAEAIKEHVHRPEEFGVPTRADFADGVMVVHLSVTPEALRGDLGKLLAAYETRQTEKEASGEQVG
jgi:hypothetical protein